MERIEDAAHCSSDDIFIPTSVKQEPETDYETDFDQNVNNDLDYQVIKADFESSLQLGY